MCSDASEYYASIITNERSIVWRNGEQFDYFLNDIINNVVVNSTEVYYSCGWKIVRVYGDNIYYSQPYPSGLGLFVEEPECESTDVRGLPYETNFERGHFNQDPGNDWPCWQILDSDNNNNGVQSYWDMYPDSHDNGSIWDKYCACHRSGNANQDGWLISPRVFLQPGHDTHLAFWTKETGSFTNEGVYICTSSNLIIGNFSQIWSQSAANASSSWKKVDIDLSAYGGYAVNIGFRYTGTNGHWWLVDDVAIEEEWYHDQMIAPYSNSFDTSEDADWFLYDVDMSGGQKCWQYNTSEHCMYHPYGQSGMPQTGWMMSPVISCTGNNKILSFKTKSTSSGTGRKNSAWIKTGNVNYYDSFLPSNFTNGATKVWEDNAYSSSWADVEIDLSPYLGTSANVIVGFKYEGTYAHNWFIDDFSISAPAPTQYTITANANPTSGGTVSGGGTYNQGTTCTLTATPASGYEFLYWKKGNTQVSTNATYSFTVTESATYTAYFQQTAPTQYTITVNANNNAWGTVSGGGAYVAGTTATIQAFPNPGYTFSNWSDGNTDNPRTITVNSDLTLVAFFGTGVGENDGTTITLYPNPAKESIRILGIEANSQVEIYNSLGELVNVMSVGPDQEIGIRDLASGLYLLRCGNAALRFVKQQ